MAKRRKSRSTVVDLPGAKELRKVNVPETGRRGPGEDVEEGARSEKAQYQSSKPGFVNRHWYRQRLDARDQMLRGASMNPNPGIEETRNQCESTVYAIDMVGQLFLQYRESLGIDIGEDEPALGQMFYDNTVPGSGQKSSPYRTVYLELNLVDGGRDL